MGVTRPQVKREQSGPRVAGWLLLRFSRSPSPFLLPGTRTRCPGLGHTACDQEVACYPQEGLGS